MSNPTSGKFYVCDELWVKTDADLLGTPDSSERLSIKFSDFV